MAQTCLQGTIHKNQKQLSSLYSCLAFFAVYPLSLASFFGGSNTVALSVAGHSTMPPLAQKDVRGRGAKRKHTSDRDEVSVDDGTAAALPPTKSAAAAADRRRGRPLWPGIAAAARAAQAPAVLVHARGREREGRAGAWARARVGVRVEVRAGAGMGNRVPGSFARRRWTGAPPLPTGKLDKTLTE